MVATVSNAGYPTNFTATNTLAVNGQKQIVGIFVSSSTAGTIKLDTAEGVVLGIFTGVAGTFYSIPAIVRSDLVITVGGVINATIFWN